MPVAHHRDKAALFKRFLDDECRQQRNAHTRLSRLGEKVTVIGMQRPRYQHALRLSSVAQLQADATLQVAVIEALVSRQISRHPWRAVGLQITGRGDQHARRGSQVPGHQR